MVLTLRAGRELAMVDHEQRVGVVQVVLDAGEPVAEAATSPQTSVFTIVDISGGSHVATNVPTCAAAMVPRDRGCTIVHLGILPFHPG